MIVCLNIINNGALKICQTVEREKNIEHLPLLKLNDIQTLAPGGTDEHILNNVDICRTVGYIQNCQRLEYDRDTALCKTDAS